ncbi:hypothetical protein ANN_08654 [Periplaneta americana]|uniref:Tc1-like transposase DDE domain-containing protein n=1 Tax=Periplaneta americana TaxID=6978 RepID=A0ABQ8T2P0_PERAM|nr:hypothetical protein ANN_08654 [Periplaneta americana]
MPSTSKSGRPLRGQAREIVYNVHQFFKRQKEEHKMDINVAHVTSEATGVSERVITRIVKEGIESLAKGSLSFSTPNGKKGERKKRVEVDNFTVCAIRQKIRGFYAVERECPTVGKLLTASKEDQVIDCGREFLRQTLKKIGFKWKKCQNNRKVLVERPDIAVWRTRYLKEIRKHRREGKYIVYVDETYIQESHSVKSCWQAEEELGILTKIGKGERLIVLHGGGEEGFVEGALLVFKSGQKHGDYHTSMNAENYCRWMENELLPKLESHRIIVMDNAKYHNVEIDKRPTTATPRHKIVEWLRKHEIDFIESDTRSQLLQIVKGVHHKRRYVVDELIMKYGHIPLQLPPYHPDLNSIELVWGDIKGQVASQSIGTSLGEKKSLVLKLMNEYPSEKWRKCCEHVRKIEDKYLDQECTVDAAVDSVIISLSNGSDDSSRSSAADLSSETDSDW